MRLLLQFTNGLDQKKHTVTSQCFHNDLGRGVTRPVRLGLLQSLSLDLRNLWSGVQIQTRRPFRLGDEIATGDWIGTVEGVTLRSTTLRTRDGQHIEVPNANILLRGINNRTLTPSRRTTLTVGVAYDTDLEDAQRILAAATARAGGVGDDPAPPAFVEEFG